MQGLSVLINTQENMNDLMSSAKELSLLAKSLSDSVYNAEVVNNIPSIHDKLIACYRDWQTRYLYYNHANELLTNHPCFQEHNIAEANYQQFTKYGGNIEKQIIQLQTKHNIPIDKHVIPSNWNEYTLQKSKTLSPLRDSAIETWKEFYKKN
jgi:hypothetical protein